MIKAIRVEIKYAAKTENSEQQNTCSNREKNTEKICCTNKQQLAN